ncbi:elongation factor G [Methylobacterium sp. CM6257]
MVEQPRCIALVGPAQSGKTLLLEALQRRCQPEEAHSDNGSRSAQTAASRTHAMSMELNLATLHYRDDTFTLIDCPGSLEFAHASRAALAACDVAVVVCEADERRLPALQVVLRELEEQGVPRLLFVNKIDTASQGLRDTLAALQTVSRLPLLMRQIPIWEGGEATGFIDLALERAFVYRNHAPSTIIALPDGELPREKEGRFTLLERLADHDDVLMEQLITDAEPARDRVMADLARELRSGQAVSVLIGSALRGNGLTRLLKALRHESPRLAETRARLGLPDDGPAVAQVLLTQHSDFGGKVSIARVLSGTFHEGDTVAGADGVTARIGGILTGANAQAERVPVATEGTTAAFARLEGIGTGSRFASDAALAAAAPPSPPPVFATTIWVRDRKDDVRLTAALTKLVEEDPSLSVQRRSDPDEVCLLGQGEMHLRVATERLAKRFGVSVERARPKVAYRETIRKTAEGHGRLKKQTGGHGQFADVRLSVRPIPRGQGFVFEDAVVGGAVPRKFIPSVEAGARAYIRRGPLGFPVEDIAVSLMDGTAHAVDSSDAAFQGATRLALDEALPAAEPVLLEPVLIVNILTPSTATAKVTGLVTGRRGQIVGYDARPDWPGWDVVDALIPEAETSDLIVELRSLTAGVGSFCARFGHMAELTGPSAEAVLAGH